MSPLKRDREYVGLLCLPGNICLLLYHSVNVGCILKINTFLVKFYIWLFAINESKATW